MARKIDGYTLIEILVTLSIMGVLLALAVPSYTDWQMERQLTSDTKKVLSFLQEERSIAFTTKQDIQFTITGTTNICDDMGNCLDTENAFIANPTNFSISSRGVFDTGYIRIQNDSLRQKYEPRYSCVVLTTTRARLGKYDGSGNCDAQ